MGYNNLLSKVEGTESQELRTMLEDLLGSILLGHHHNKKTSDKYGTLIEVWLLFSLNKHSDKINKCQVSYKYRTLVMF